MTTSSIEGCAKETGHRECQRFLRNFYINPSPWPYFHKAWSDYPVPLRCVGAVVPIPFRGSAAPVDIAAQPRCIFPDCHITQPDYSMTSPCPGALIPIFSRRSAAPVDIAAQPRRIFPDFCFEERGLGMT